MEDHKYVSFIVEEGGSKYCINLKNVICFVENDKVKLYPDNRSKNYIGIASFRDNVYNVINTKKVFEVNSEPKFHHYILMYLEETQILIPVLKILEIFNSNNIVQIAYPSKQFNFVVKNKDALNILVENYFFD